MKNKAKKKEKLKKNSERTKSDLHGNLDGFSSKNRQG